TTLVLDIYTGPTSSSHKNFARMGNSLFLTATDASHPTRLWYCSTSGKPASSVVTGSMQENVVLATPSTGSPAGVARPLMSGYEMAYQYTYDNRGTGLPPMTGEPPEVVPWGLAPVSFEPIHLAQRRHT